MPPSEIEIDTQRLKSKAKLDDIKESYETIEQALNYKIGVGTRMDQQKDNLFFLEVVISLCEYDDDLEIESLRGKLGVLKGFEKLGYTVRMEEDNSIICEKDVLEANIYEEYKKSKIILDDLSCVP